MRAGGTVKPCRGTGSWPGRRDAHCKLYPRIRLAALVVVSVVGLAASSSAEPEVTVPENVEREDRLPSPGGTWTRPRQPGPTYVAPAWHLNADQQLDFYTGLSFFRSPWVTAPSSTTARDGLGPLFNSHSCEGCHKNGGRGRSLLDDPHALATVVRISVENSDGTIGPHARYGWQLQVKATYRREGEASLAMKSEAVSVAGAPGTLRRPRLEITPHDPGEDPADWQMSARVAPALLGMGLLAAIPQSDLLDNADPDDLDQDGISGRPHWRGNGASRAIGRFGWKALHATVAAQTGAALRDDIGIFTPDGERLFTTENDFATGRGMIVCRSARTLEVIGEFPSGGIGPHQIKLLGDNLMAVANGGIRTHPDHPRRKLNLDSMRPNLTLVGTRNGEVAHQAAPDDARSSIRHMDVTADGDIVLGLQHEGPPTADSALVLLYGKAAGKLAALPVPLAVQRRMKQYTASVCVDPASNHAMVTCPRGHAVTFWDLDGRGCVAHRRMRDVAGVALDRAAGEFVATNGGGSVVRFDSTSFQLRRTATRRFEGLRWDNHLTVSSVSMMGV